MEKQARRRRYVGTAKWPGGEVEEIGVAVKGGPRAARREIARALASEHGKGWAVIRIAGPAAGYLEKGRWEA